MIRLPTVFSIEVVLVSFIFMCCVEWYFLLPFQNLKQLALIFTVSNKLSKGGGEKPNTADISVGAASSSCRM